MAGYFFLSLSDINASEIMNHLLVTRARKKINCLQFTEERVNLYCTDTKFDNDIESMIKLSCNIMRTNAYFYCFQIFHFKLLERAINIFY